MRRLRTCVVVRTVLAVVCTVAQLGAAEFVWDLSRFKAGEQPPGFRSAVSGEGKEGDWRILEIPREPASTNAVLQSSVQVRDVVLAQVAREATDEHFPLLIWDKEVFGDFTFTAQLKAVEGEMEQMAGLAFRIQDEKNYYVLRLSALGNTVRFYKFVDGARTAPIGPEVPVERGVWHTLSVECRGNQIRCSYDGKELFPPLQDGSFSAGKLGFWTKSDAVSHFQNARVVFTPRESLARRLVRQAMEDHGRLLGARISAAVGEGKEARIVASHVAAEVGQPSGETEAKVVRDGTVFYGKAKGEVKVVLPLHDRNGETVAALQLTLKAFPGQTQDNALARARPIVAQMEAEIRTQRDLVD